MTIVANVAKQRLLAGELAVGFSVLHWRTVDIARIAKTCGFDWLFIDMEHGTMDVETASRISVAALDTAITPLVRVPGHEHHHATRVLDGGAMGVVVPHVDTVEQARRVVDNCRYPPHGHRSLTGALAQAGYATMPADQMIAALNENTLVVVMLESPEAIDNADAIAAVDGIDVLLIGSNDLAAEMGIPGRLGDEKIAAAFARMIAAAARNGKSAGMAGIYDQELTRTYVEMGVRFVLGGGDLGLMMAAARNRAGFLRSIPLATK